MKWLLLTAGVWSSSLALSPKLASMLKTKRSKPHSPHVDSVHEMRKPAQALVERKPVDVLGVLDFECTCAEGWDYAHQAVPKSSFHFRDDFIFIF